jgi:hypothetical protein
MQTLSVMPAKAGIQYAAPPDSISGASGILDHPLSRMMTAAGVTRTKPYALNA